jgi:hypothetical protein
MATELSSGKLTSKTVDRVSIVLMAGIAAEALELGQAEGGAGDEQALVSLLGNLSWSPSAISMQARWAVLQAILLLRENRDAYYSIVDLMAKRAPLGDCVDCLERKVRVPLASIAKGSTVVVSSKTDSQRAFDVYEDTIEKELSLTQREEEVVKQLQRIKDQLAELDS